jgi:TM2 domain-containing membrane protein YozV
MTKALRAALLSGLVFPGSGQFYLKRYTRGLVYLLVTIGALAAMILPVVEMALTIVDKMTAQGGNIDMNAIANASAQISASMHSLVFNLGLWSLIACWVVATSDAYRLGKKGNGTDRAVDGEGADSGGPTDGFPGGR